MTRARLEALLGKYETLHALRSSREEAIRKGWLSFPLSERPARRRTMQSLAARFPGALRELDEADAEALAARIAELKAALAGGPRLPWMEACALFHEALREALATRRGASSPFWEARSAFASELARPSGGRLLDVVWTAVGAELGVTPGEAERLVYPNAPARGIRR